MVKMVARFEERPGTAKQTSSSKRIRVADGQANGGYACGRGRGNQPTLLEGVQETVPRRQARY